MYKNRVLKIIFCYTCIVFVISGFKKNELPDKKDILKQLYKNPVQMPTAIGSFTKESAGITYTIIPLYNYELYAMVVSCFDTSAWWNIYHRDWQDFMNKKDIAVIWGDNLTSEAYKKMSFKSTSFECVYSTRDLDAWRKFKKECFSNNHLLCAQKEIERKVMSVRRADQIYLQGYLVKYTHNRDEQFERGSSTTRFDSGAWSCETIYVTDFRILKRANTFWHIINSWATYIIILCVFIAIGCLFK